MKKNGIEAFVSKFDVGRTEVNFTEKRVLAGYICKNIIENEKIISAKRIRSIFLGAGSTVCEIGKCLTETTQRLNIITNNVRLLIHWAHLGKNDKFFDKYTINVVKGPVEFEDLSIENTKVEADICFIGTSGFHSEQGLTCNHPYTPGPEKNIIRHNKKIIIVATRPKIGTPCLNGVATAGAIKKHSGKFILVTNSKKNNVADDSEEEIQKIKSKLNVSVIQVELDGKEKGLKSDWMKLL